MGNRYIWQSIPQPSGFGKLRGGGANPPTPLNETLLHITWDACSIIGVNKVDTMRKPSASTQLLAPSLEEFAQSQWGARCHMTNCSMF